MTVRKAAFYAIFICIQFVIAELILQVFYRATNGDWLVRRVDIPIYASDEHRVFRVDSNLDYRHATNEFDVTYYTDNLGFRAASPDTHTDVSKGEGVYRVMFLGPSFNFGTANNYEDAYVTLIGSELQLKGRQIEFINVGTPSQPPRFQLCWLEAVGRDFQPDLIVQTVYGNPILSETRCDRDNDPPRVVDGVLYKTEPDLRKQIKAQIKRSAVVFYAWYIKEALVPPETGDQGLGTDMYAATQGSEATDDEILAVYHDYGEFIRGALGPDVPYVFLYVPFSYAIHPEYVGRFAGKAPMSAEDLALLAGRVQSLLAANQMTYIDPTPSMNSAAGSAKMYNYLDVHLTPAGNRTLAASALAQLQPVLDGRDVPASSAVAENASGEVDLSY